MPMLLALNMLLGIQTMVNLKMDKKFFSITVSAAFLSLGLNPLLIHYWNAPGAAISWFLTEVFCTVTMYIVLRRNKISVLKYKYFQINNLKSYLTPSIEKLKEKLKF